MRCQWSIGRRSSPLVPSPCLCLRCILLHMNIFLLVPNTRHLFLSLLDFSLLLSLSLCLREHIFRLSGHALPMQPMTDLTKYYFHQWQASIMGRREIISLTNSESLYSSLNTWPRSPELLLAKIHRSRFWLVENRTMNQRRGKSERRDKHLT